MSASWHDDDEEFRVAGVRAGLKTKPRFSVTEIKLLLESVMRNRYIILRKFNQGVSAETKKQTWAEITNQINGLGENRREVRQIMKKWADLKCDGKRRIAALRGPNGNVLRSKSLSPVERMVHKILMMSPKGDGDSDLDLGEDEDFSKLYAKGLAPTPAPYSYLSLTDNHSLPGGACMDMSPLSSPEKELGGDPFQSSSDFDLDPGDDGERTMDFDENDDPALSSQPSSLPPPASATSTDAPLRVKPVHTYSRNSGQTQNHIQNHNYSRPTSGPSSSGFPAASDTDAAASSAAPPSSQSPASSEVTASAPPPASCSSSSSVAANDTTSNLNASSCTVQTPPASSAAASSTAPSSSVLSAGSNPPPHPSASGSDPLDPLPAGASSCRSRDNVAQMASQSLQQQRASRMLLTSVSQSLELLAQSVQLLVESQQEFVQESLLLQRETVDILRDFSNTALAMLRDKSNSGHLVTHHHPPSHF